MDTEESKNIAPTTPQKEEVAPQIPTSTEPQTPRSPQKRSKWKRIVVMALLAPVALSFLLIFLLYLPPVQRGLARLAEQQVKKATGIDLTIGELGIQFPLTLSLKEIRAISPQGDTLVDLGELYADIPLFPLFNGQIETPRLDARRVSVFFPDSARTMIIGGGAQHLEVGAVAVSLTQQTVDIGAVLFQEGNFSLFSVDTVKNPNPKPVTWKIAIDHIDLQHAKVDITMPLDSLYVRADVTKGSMDGFSFDIKTLRLESDRVSLRAASGSYARDNRPPHTPYVDYTHLYGYDLEVDGTKLVQQKTLLMAEVSHLSLREHSGARINDVSGSFFMQDGLIELDDMQLTTPLSRADGSFRLPLAIFTKKDPKAILRADLRAKLHAQDVFYFTTIDVKKMLGKNASILSAPIDLELRTEGTIKEINIDKAYASIPQIVSMDLEGTLCDVLTPKQLNGDLRFDVRSEGQTRRILPLLGPGLAHRIAIPSRTRLQGKAHFTPNAYALEALLSTAQAGSIKLKGRFSPSTMHYVADAQAKHFNVAQLLPHDSIGIVDLNLHAKGNGFNFLSAKNSTQVNLNLNHLVYKRFTLDSVDFVASMHHGIFHAHSESSNQGALLALNLDGALSDGQLAGTINAQIDTVALHSIGFVDKPLTFGGTLSGNFTTNLGNRHAVNLEAERLFVDIDSARYSYDSLSFRAMVAPDTTQAALVAGDLYLETYIGAGVERLGQTASQISNYIPQLLSDSIQPEALSKMLDLLPPIGAELVMGQQNPISNILRKTKTYFSAANVMLTNSPQEGLDLEATIQDLRQDTLRIDHVYASISSQNGASRTTLSESVYKSLAGFTWPDAQPIRYDHIANTRQGAEKYLRMDVRVNKKKYRNQQPFTIYLHAISDLRTLDLDANYQNAGKESYALGAILFKNASGIGISFKEKPIVLAGYRLHANPKNALFYNLKNSTIHSYLLLKSDAKAELSLISKEEESSAYGSLDLLIRNLELSDVDHFFGMESLEGNTFADINIIRNSKTGIPSATGDISINNLAYDKMKIGHIGAALFYEPRDNSSHYVTAQVNYNGQLAFSAEGTYSPNNTASPISMMATVDGFPLSLANPFIGAQNAALDGTIDGMLSINGRTSNILLDGMVTPHNASFYLPLVGNKFAIETPPVQFRDSKLLFDNFRLRSQGKKQSFLINGYLGLLGREALTTDLRITGHEVEVIDSKAKRGQMLYGKLLASADLQVKGHVTHPKVRGKIDVLGGTNITYVYSQAAVKATDRFTNIVEFTDFADTLRMQDAEAEGLKKISLGGMNVALDLHIDPAVRIGVDLSADHQDHVYVQGGGDLRFVYPPYGEMNLTGRYELSGGGDVRYAFPVVGRKIFVINPSSYISWSGNLMNPLIDFKATQRVRANVVEDGKPRKVNFDVYIVAKDQLENINLAFDVAAPEDLNIQGELSSMSAEERGKQAVGLMVSGSYLASEPSSTSPQQLLSDLAVNELNSLTSKILEGTDFNIGMELHDAAEYGSAYTDYTYSFSKRLFNDRLSVTIGGKVATGNIPTNHEQTFIDNFNLEYRLDKAGSMYLKGFHKRNSDNLIEGLVTETGIGFLIRKKFKKLSELFQRSVPPKTPQEPMPKTAVLVAPDPQKATKPTNYDKEK